MLAHFQHYGEVTVLLKVRREATSLCTNKGNWNGKRACILFACFKELFVSRAGK
jgi:hypothetical protein